MGNGCFADDTGSTLPAVEVELDVLAVLWYERSCQSQGRAAT
jgi:hypothetical protein